MASDAVVLAESRSGEQVEMKGAVGDALVELCDAHGAPIPFSCRSASCGTCRVQVLEGAEALAPPRADELDLLYAFDLDPARFRLACQARLAAGDVRLRVRALED